MVIGPLDLTAIFINYFAGTIEIFFFMMMAVFTFFASKFRIPNTIFLLLVSLLIIVLADYFSLLYSITILLGALFFYYTLSKIQK